MRKNKTLALLLGNIVLLGIITQVILFIFFRPSVYHAVGLWCGIVVALFSGIMIGRSAEDSLDYGADAENYVRKQYLLRMLIAGILIGVVLYFDYGNPITILVGVSMLRVAALFHPVTEKLIGRIGQKKGGRISGRK